MENENTNNFESREYQIELFEMAVDNNLILYLPTGSGKTFIATLLIKHLGRNTGILKKPILEGGKRTFFLVNTVALVEQQANQIQSHTTFDVGKYSGDMGVDNWSQAIWTEEINEKQVLVMTCQIFLHLILNNTISLSNVNLLIFDECHRGVSNHPMRQVMMNFKNIPKSQHPRVLGLTATLLNGNIAPNKVSDEIRTLENTFIARIATSLNEEMVRMYSTNPSEKKVTYNENETGSKCYQIRDRILDHCKEFIEAIQVEELETPDQKLKPNNTRQIDSNAKKTNKRLKNLVDDIHVNMNDLGVYGGKMAILAHLVQLQQLLPNSQMDSTRLIYQSIITSCVLLKKHLENEIKIGVLSQNMTDSEALRYFSSDKVRKLFDILKMLKDEDSAIVFVNRRFTAKILYYLLKRASALDPRLSQIKSNFIVGYNVGNPYKDTRENYLQRSQNKKVMNQFNQKELNVLFASNVVEEGIDIKQCNFVIMFDPPMDFRAYIQSKGRARDKESHYVLMKCRSDVKFEERYESYRQVEGILKNMLYGGKARMRTSPTKEELDENLFAEIPGLEPYKPFGTTGPTITALSAISLINRYFASLKQDKFTKITPYWFLEEKGDKVRCILQLPMECKIRGFVEGTWQKNQDNAKRSVALEACKKLHKNGELNDLSLLPVGFEIPDVERNMFTPNYDPEESFTEVINDNIVRLGTKRHKRICQKKWADVLCECRPQPGQTAYLHVLQLRPVYTAPADNHRLAVLHQQLNQPSQFALISSKQLPTLAPFPLYMSTGELEATVQKSQPITLDEKHLQLVIDFHSVIFDDVLAIAKKFMVRDNYNMENSYLIAPVFVDANEKININWNIVHKTLTPFPSSHMVPSDEDRLNLQVTDDNYLGRIVSPWYRTVPNTKYLVTKVSYDKSENSEFPSDNYATYKEYFEDKYKIEPLLKGQPLLEVKALSSRLNSTKPRALTKQLKRKKEENEDFEVWLLPEFCVKYPLVGHYWLKAQLLPSVLHRVSQLCSAEELRSRIAKDTSVGLVNLPSDMKCCKLQEDESLKQKNNVSDKQQALTPLNNLISKASSQSKPVPEMWGDEEEPLDIERHMDTVTMFDIINYRNFIGKPLLGLASPSKMTTMMKSQVIAMVEPPPLEMLNRNTKGKGPEQVEVMQSLTAAVANDFINCERLETLGDCFLKFVVSLTLFETEPDMLEGQLTYIKGQVVGNKNLFFCGRKKNLGPILDVHDFSPNEEWVSPGFCVERSVRGVLTSANLNPNCLYHVQLSTQERTTGILTVTKTEINDKLFEAEDVINQNCTFTNQLAFTDKNISDAVEALLGTYLKSCGIFGALAVLNWFEVMDPSLSTTDLFILRSNPPAKSNGNPNSHLQQPDYLEQILNYKFQDRNYMLQALTHPSYNRNNITLCYQRLEFLGDAIIDFLITVHIFEKCTALNPGDLTDLRSALVNNITLGAVTVRNQLHKFLLHRSNKLNECMMRFVRHQEERNHVIDDDILFLFEENEVNIAEAVDVPKTLGDIFEALVGAIFLDSGKDINLVWKIVYNFLKDEIGKFQNDVPKNHVRMLYETSTPHFSTKIEDNGAVMVTVDFLYKGKEIKFNGFGDNKHQAKRAAAKHALRFLRNPTTLDNE